MGRLSPSPHATPPRRHPHGPPPRPRSLRTTTAGAWHASALLSDEGSKGRVVEQTHPPGALCELRWGWSQRATLGRSRRQEVHIAPATLAATLPSAPLLRECRNGWLQNRAGGTARCSPHVVGRRPTARHVRAVAGLSCRRYAAERPAQRTAVRGWTARTRARCRACQLARGCFCQPPARLMAGRLGSQWGSCRLHECEGQVEYQRERARRALQCAAAGWAPSHSWRASARPWRSVSPQVSRRCLALSRWHSMKVGKVEVTLGARRYKRRHRWRGIMTSAS